MSGKTTLAAQLVQAGRNNRPLIILDRNNDDRWPLEDGDFFTTNRAEFLRAVNDPENDTFVAVIDESGAEISRGNQSKDLEWIATIGRHAGIQCVLIAQRANQIDKNIRSQCVNVVCFRIPQSDADLLADEFAEPRLREAGSLGQGEYLACFAFKPVVKMMLTHP